MDVQPESPETAERNAKQLLQEQLDRARAQRDDVERAISDDAERIAEIRTALDAVAAAVWRDVFAQQQRAKDGDNLAAAFQLKWFGGYQFAVIGALVLLAVASVYLLQGAGVAVTAVLYAGLAFANYLAFRGRCVDQVKKARRSYLGEDGNDIRFVAFTHLETGLQHPLIGFDGPRKNGDLNDRSWKIPGVRDGEALHETFVEIIDERRGTVLLTRFPDKKPTLVHADLENPFIRAFGVFFQRALERQLPAVQEEAEKFREVVLRVGERKRIGDTIKTIEAELQEYDGTQAIMSNAPVLPSVRNKLLRQIVLFRLQDPAISRGMMLFGSDTADAKEVVQVVARASAASFIPFSFSSMRIGYVGQGAAQVVRTFESARRTRSIVYIEDGECLFEAGSSSGYESMRREVLQALLKQWDALEEQAGVWIVASAPNREDVDAAVLSRFGALIDLSPELRSEPTIVIDALDASEEPQAELSLPGDAGERVRILAAMFAHVETMERQGITVPRGVLIASPSPQKATIEDLASQAGLPLFPATIDDLDAAIAQAREEESAIIALSVPANADPGHVAHLCVTIDDLTASGVALFVVGETTDAALLDPELRVRFGEIIEIPGLESDERRRMLLALIAGKPVDFDVEQHLEHLDVRTDGMGEERLREYVEEAIGRAALRAIELGKPDRVRVSLEDFGVSLPSAT